MLKLRSHLLARCLTLRVTSCFARLSAFSLLQVSSPFVALGLSLLLLVSTREANIERHHSSKYEIPPSSSSRCAAALCRLRRQQHPRQEASARSPDSTRQPPLCGFRSKRTRTGQTPFRDSTNSGTANRMPGNPDATAFCWK